MPTNTYVTCGWWTHRRSCAAGR